MEASALRHQPGLGALGGRSPLLRLQRDERLVALVRQGNAGAFEALVQRYQARLLAFCRHMLGSKEDAEDVLQEVFAAAYNALLADERPINARPWLYRIARNRSPEPPAQAQAGGQDSMDIFERDNGTTTAETVHRREEFRQIVADVQELPETQRTALLLREIDALSYEQIAEAMDTTVPSVKSLLVRARVSLAEAAEARLLTCEEVRLELGQVAEGLTRTSAPVRRHLRSCERCRAFRSELRNTTKALAAVFPLGPLVVLKKLGLAKLGFGGAAAGGAATAGGAGSPAAPALPRRGAAAAPPRGGAISAGVGHARLQGRRRHGRGRDRDRRSRGGRARGQRDAAPRPGRGGGAAAGPADAHRPAPAAPARPGRRQRRPTAREGHGGPPGRTRRRAGARPRRAAPRPSPGRPSRQPSGRHPPTRLRVRRRSSHHSPLPPQRELRPRDREPPPPDPTRAPRPARSPARPSAHTGSRRARARRLGETAACRSPVTPPPAASRSPAGLASCRASAAQATGASPITFSRRSSAFIAKARVSSIV